MPMKNLFLTSSNNYVMHDVINNIPNFKKGMKLAFIPTAAEVEEGDRSWLDQDRQAAIEVGFDVFDFSFTGKTEEQVRMALDSVDAVLMSGGNTYYLLQEIQKSECTAYLRERVDTGMVYIGTSAGSILAGPSIDLVGDLDDRSLAPDLNGDDCLGLVDVIVFPHWGSPHFQKRYEKCMQNGYKKGNKLVLLTDDQYLWVRDEWYQIMSI